MIFRSRVAVEVKLVPILFTFCFPFERFSNVPFDGCTYTNNESSSCVAQLVERSLPIPEVRGSNPVISKYLFILNICLLSNVYWKDKNKEKEAGNGPFWKNNESRKAERARARLWWVKFKLRNKKNMLKDVLKRFGCIWNVFCNL